MSKPLKGNNIALDCTRKSCISRVLSAIDYKILKEMSDCPEGVRAKTLLKLLQTKKRTLFYHLNTLQRLGLIKNIYPIWKIQAGSKILHSLITSDNVQLHKFTFVMQLIRKPYWWSKRANKLMRLKDFHFMKETKWGNERYQQLIKDNFLIQTFSSSIIFINQRKYWGSSAYDCFVDALNDTMEMIRFCEEYFNFKFVIDGVPHLNVKDHHYVKIHDVLAKRCKKDGKGFDVVINGEKRAWVDFSIPFGFELGGRSYAPDDERKYTRFVTDIIENEAPLNSEVMQEMTDLKQIIMQQQEILNNLVANSEVARSDKPDYVG